MMSDAERLNHILERIGEIDESLNVSFEEYSGTNRRRFSRIWSSSEKPPGNGHE